jgi:hypothetical protein
MGGGLLQLVAYGAQDVYLTGNPQITFFKVVYRRHTNFSMESVKQSWSGNPLTGVAECLISRNGDLINGMHLEVEYNATNDIYNLGHSMIETVEVKIGGELMDRHTGDFMEFYSQLTEKTDVEDANFLYQVMTNAGGMTISNGNSGRIYVPLLFWFCRNSGLALPLIALQYHDVKIVLKLNEDLLKYGLKNSKLDKNTLYADCIYLDTDERKRFAQVSHEYLIEQVQYRKFIKNSNTYNDEETFDISFLNHPVKELFWIQCPEKKSGAIKPFCWKKIIGIIGGDKDYYSKTNTKALIKINGQDRFSERFMDYFYLKQPHDYHSEECPIPNGGSGNTTYYQNLCLYSFALKPEEHQPSGTCNFSRIDSAELLFHNTGWNTNNEFEVASPDNGIEVYAINYNVLRIMSGMGGLAYSN